MSLNLEKCPSCDGELAGAKKCCPKCGRWLMTRGISFYAIWTVLSLAVLSLSVYFCHVGFVMLTRML